MKKKQKELSKTDELIGIDDICRYAEQGPVDLMRWRIDFGFPMSRVDQIWCSDKAAIKQWYEGKGLNPRTASSEALLKIWNREQRKTTRKHNKNLLGVYEIIDFIGIKDISRVQVWHRQFKGCPIVRASDGSYECDTDALEIWLDEFKVLQGGLTREEFWALEDPMEPM